MEGIMLNTRRELVEWAMSYDCQVRTDCQEDGKRECCWLQTFDDPSVGIFGIPLSPVFGDWSDLAEFCTKNMERLKALLEADQFNYDEAGSLVETHNHSLGWSNFAKEHSRPGTGNGYTELPDEAVVKTVLNHWYNAVPGAGEKDIKRKVLVRVPGEGFWCPPRAKLVMGMPVQAEIIQRQEGEDPYVQVWVDQRVTEKYNALYNKPAATVDVVCYSAEALLENGGKRSTDCDWEIVTILCNEEGGRGEPAPMEPLTMARNQLQKPGGTHGEYSPTEYAEAIWYHSTRKGIRVKTLKTP